MRFHTLAIQLPRGEESNGRFYMKVIDNLRDHLLQMLEKSQKVANMLFKRANVVSISVRAAWIINTLNSSLTKPFIRVQSANTTLTERKLCTSYTLRLIMYLIEEKDFIL